MPKFLANINLNKNELQNARIHVLASAPANPVGGQLYYNSTDGKLYQYDGVGSAWIDLTASASNATTSAPGLIQLAGDLNGTSSSATSPVITSGAITAAKIADALKPTAGASTSTESLRALGTTSSTALAGNTTLDAITAPTASLSLNSQKITSVQDPASAQDAATKAYVDSVASGLDSKASVRVATTAAITLSGTQTIDGVAVIATDRVLVKDQAAPAANGIYVVAAGSWTRASDMDAWTEVPSAYAWVEEGTANGDSGWVVTSDTGGTLNTTAISWTLFSSASSLIAGDGLTKASNTINVVGTTDRISVSGDAINISTNYAGQATITTLGTITTGTWTGTTIAIANGGTGQTTSKAARETGLAAAGYYTSATHASGTSITITQETHALRSSQALNVQVQESATGDVVYPDVTVGATGDVVVTFAASQSANSHRVTIVG
jgi:hypothetical protein